jgi:hypothetical protein
MPQGGPTRGEQQPIALVLGHFIEEHCERMPAVTRARYLRILGWLSSYLQSSARDTGADQILPAVKAFFAALDAGAIAADEHDLQGARTVGKRLTTWLGNVGYV